MTVILFDTAARQHLLPFTHTRPVADIRCGILTMRQRWEKLLQTASGTLTESYLQEVFTLQAGSDNLLVNGAVFGSEELATAIKALNPNSKLVKGGIMVAARTSENKLTLGGFEEIADGLDAIEYGGEVDILNHVWDIFSMNDKALRADYVLITQGRKSAAIPEGVTVSGEEQLFIEEGAKVYPGCIINAATGPVYIGKDAEVLEGSLMRGPIAIGEHAAVKMGAKLYGATTIGPGCKVGGEISNVVFFENSNKGHDGYLGNAVIGEWCNLGADTNCSNLKNNYDEVKIWDEIQNKLIKTGLTFCGLIMGDHSKCGINTMFNTGTVVGVSCNIFGGDFPDKFVPSFSWGGSESIATYSFDKAIETANRMMARRGKSLSQQEVVMYRHIFAATEAQRATFAH